MMLIFAHYGGIDEIAIFLVPALAAIWSLRWAERRARRVAEEKELLADTSQEPTDVD